MNAKYEYLAGYGEIGKKSAGRGQEKLSLQFCKESWNGYECFAVRSFAADGTPCKGIALNADQAKALKDLLNQVDLDAITLNKKTS